MIIEYINDLDTTASMVAEQDLNTDRIFEIGGRFYRATMPILKGEAITSSNSEEILLTDILSVAESGRGQ